jgi:hypothetical protein
MITTALPQGAAGEPYFQCVQLSGKPQGLTNVSVPKGVEVTLKGKALCVSTNSFPSQGFDWSASVVSCKSCDLVDIGGSITAKNTDCACVEVAFPIPTQVWDDVKVNQYFEKYIPYNGSEVEFCNDCLPDCLSACVVGRSIKLFGTLKRRVTEIRFALKNSCTCECVEFVATVVDPCIVMHGATVVALDCPTLPPITPPAPTPPPCVVSHGGTIIRPACPTLPPIANPVPLCTVVHGGTTIHRNC